MAALTVGEEEGGKTTLQIDTMACASTGGEATEAGRGGAKRRKVNLTNGNEIALISAAKWDVEGACKSHHPSFHF